MTSLMAFWLVSAAEKLDANWKHSGSWRQCEAQPGKIQSKKQWVSAFASDCWNSCKKSWTHFRNVPSMTIQFRKNLGSPNASQTSPKSIPTYLITTRRRDWPSPFAWLGQIHSAPQSPPHSLLRRICWVGWEAVPFWNTDTQTTFCKSWVSLHELLPAWTQQTWTPRHRPQHSNSTSSWDPLQLS